MKKTLVGLLLFCLTITVYAQTGGGGGGGGGTLIRDGLIASAYGGDINIPVGYKLPAPILIFNLTPAVIGTPVSHIVGGVKIDIISSTATIASLGTIIPIYAFEGGLEGTSIHVGYVQRISNPMNEKAGTMVFILFPNFTITKETMFVAYSFVGMFSLNDTISTIGHGITALDISTGQSGNALLFDDTHFEQKVVFYNSTAQANAPAQNEPTPMDSEWLKEVIALYDKHLCREPDAAALEFFWKRWPTRVDQVERDLTTSREYFLKETVAKRKTRG